MGVLDMADPPVPNGMLITDGKAAAPTLSLLIPQPPPGHDPVRVSYPWAPMC